MFGYITPDNPYLYLKDLNLYKALYCGLCKSMGGTCGQISRFTLNYDITFLSALVHNIMDKDVVIKQQKCAVHWFKRRSVALGDEITAMLGNLNVILSYYKLSDDVQDEGKGRIKRKIFARAYKRAKKQEPELDEIVGKRYSELRKYEKDNCSSVDMAADPFGNMMADAVRCVLKEKSDSNIEELAYMTGKWIYLIDALDDFDKDKKKNNYNVFAKAYPDCDSYKILQENHKEDIYSTFSGIIIKLRENLAEVKFSFNHDLTDNIILKGIPLKTKQIIEKEDKKCKETLTQSWN